MASVSRHLCRCIQTVSRRIPSKRQCYEVSRYRQLSTTSRRWAADDVEDNDSSTANSASSKPIPFSVDLLTRDERELFEAASINEQNEVKDAWLQLQSQESAAFRPRLEQEALAFQRDPEVRAFGESVNDTRVPNKELGYWGDDEDDELGRVPDGDDGPEGDMTSIAHDELALHREIREYARLAAWDMPFLSKFAKPFSPPPLTSPFRFRYTTYMGEQHPAQRKIVVEFSPADLSLTAPQQLKLQKLVGARYNPSKNIIKMSCEKFDTPAQNKRYLGDLIDTLITEAKDTKDTFEDIPLDVRHHKFKPKPKYPAEWRLNEQNAKQLETLRIEAKESLDARQLVDGEAVVDVHISQEAAGRKPEPVAIPAGGAGGGRRRGVRA